MKHCLIAHQLFAMGTIEVRQFVYTITIVCTGAILNGSTVFDKMLPVDDNAQLQHIIAGLKLRVRNENIIFLFLNQNICCGYTKEPSQ